MSVIEECVADILWNGIVSFEENRWHVALIVDVPQLNVDWRLAGSSAGGIRVLPVAWTSFC